jgi:hypothetical protein
LLRPRQALRLAASLDPLREEWTSIELLYGSFAPPLPSITSRDY